MRLDVRRLASRKVTLEARDWIRIFQTSHAATPTGAGYGSSRFSSPGGAFRVLYAAEDFATAFAEAVVRDRFEDRLRRYLYRQTFEALVAAEIQTLSSISVIDLTNGGAYELGVDTDAKGARAHTKGQAFAEALHQATAVDGVLFSSRLTGGRCVAVFDRGFGKLTARPAVDLIRVQALYDEIGRLGITVRRNRNLP